jgi:hypothetical protein
VDWLPTVHRFVAELPFSRIEGRRKNRRLIAKTGMVLCFRPRKLRTKPVCHAFYSSASFYQQLFELDQELAKQVKQSGCSCGGTLHSARYPRKPRGVARHVLGDTCSYRFSFCCSVDGCRRRCTPPSVRFLGRKLYLGAIIILITALEQGLTRSRRHTLIESLDLCPQTLHRLRCWWLLHFTKTTCWRSLQSQFLPPH